MRLVELGNLILYDLAPELDPRSGQPAAATKPTFMREYQRWYSESLAVLRQLLPGRCKEFAALYEAPARRKEIAAVNYTIQDWFLGIRSRRDLIIGDAGFDDRAVAVMRFGAQLRILDAAKSRFESSLHDIRQIVQADLFDSELSAARGLVRAGFLRPAGVVAGVVLEKHLQDVCSAHAIAVKKNPTIADLNDALKNANTIDVPTWRQIQRLGDLRNLCGHKKDREPTKDEAVELVDVTEKVIKSVY